MSGGGDGLSLLGLSRMTNMLKGRLGKARRMIDRRRKASDVAEQIASDVLGDGDHAKQEGDIAMYDQVCEKFCLRPC